MLTYVVGDAGAALAVLAVVVVVPDVPRAVDVDEALLVPQAVSDAGGIGAGQEGADGKSD